MVLVNCRVNTGTEEFCTVYCVQYMWSRMPYWTLICLWLAAVEVALAKEGDSEKQKREEMKTVGEGDILASVRDILYEDVESNEIETDVPVLKR
jgi:hypothetical protein